MPLGTMVGLGPGNIVLDADPAPLPKGNSPLTLPKKFGPCLLWPNGWMDQDATWYEGRPLPRPHCVTRGTQLPLPKRGHSPQFSAHVQTVGWIKMPLGTKVRLGPGHIVSDGAQLHFLPPKWHSPLHFSAHVCCGQTAGWIKMLPGTKVGLSPATLCCIGTQLPQKGGRAPNFRPVFIVAKRSPISAILLSTYTP